MKRYRVYHGWRRVLYSWPFVVMLGVLVLLLGRSAFRVYIKWDKSREQLSEVRTKYAEEVARMEHLQGEVDKLETERGWEESVRTNYGLAKPGEGVIIIVDKSTTTSR